jgi:hypothetical protein
MEALSKEIKTYFAAAVTIDYDGPSNKHPIIVLNALKNIIGDNREKPSKLLLDSMKKLIDKYPKRTDDDIILNNIAKEGIGLTVFISDLEDACQRGNSQKMENAAAKIQWVSENGLGVLEVLIEVAIQDFSRLGILSYHLQRAHHFKQEQSKTWSYNRCLLKEIAKGSMPAPHEKVKMEPKFMIPHESQLLGSMASAHRLWDGQFVRIEGIRRELSHWFDSIQVESDNSNKINSELERYVKNGGNLFIDFAEQLIKKPNFDFKIIQLESLRFFLKKASNKHYSLISKHIEELFS